MGRFSREEAKRKEKAGKGKKKLKKGRKQGKQGKQKKEMRQKFLKMCGVGTKKNICNTFFGSFFK